MIGAPTRVRRETVAVRYVQVEDEVSQIRLAWPELEDAVGSLRGRKFLAAFDPLAGWYRACVQVREGVSDAELVLPAFEVPGGEFLRVRLRGEPPVVYDEIAPAYAQLEAAEKRDDTRLSLEVYRRHDVIDVLMPLK